VIYCSPGEEKHKMAEQHLATHETSPGLFLILVSKAPALVWEAQMTGTGKLGQLKPKDPWPYVNHYSFHILDPDWGHLTIKMSGHPPFGAQVILNGHEYVACQAQKAGVGFTKQDNCFTTITNAAGLAQVADTLSQQETAGRLRQFCERWIYTTCLCFALDLEEQKRSVFSYHYSVFQMEYSRNLLFQSGQQMDQIFQALIDRSRSPLDLDRVKTRLFAVSGGLTREIKFACHQIDDAGEVAERAIPARLGLRRLYQTVDALEDAVVDA